MDRMSQTAIDDKPQSARLAPEQVRRRKARSLAIAISLAILVGLFYVVTIAKLGANVLNRPL
jgi:hypothetical protein